MPALRANLLLSFGLLAALVFPTQSLPQQPPQKTQVQAPRLDRHGQPLPAAALARMGTAQFRHQGTVTFLGFVGDSNTLLGVGGDVDARIWDLSKTQQLRRFAVPPPSLNQMNPFNMESRPPLALSRDGKTIAWWDGDDVVVKDLTTNKETRSLTRQKLMEQGKLQGGNQGRLILAADGQALLIEESDGVGKFVAPPGAGNFTNGRRVSLWRTTTGDMVKWEETGPNLQINAFALSPDGKRLALLLQPNQNEKKPFLLKEKEKKEEKEKDKVKEKEKDKEKVKAQDENGPVLRLLDTTTGKTFVQFKVEPTNSREILFLGNGKTLAILHQNKGVSIHDAISGKELQTFAAGVVAQSLQASADGKRLLTVASREVVLWDVATAKELRRIPLEAEKVQPNNPFGQQPRGIPVALSPDGKTLAVGSRSTFRLWDLDTGKESTQAEGNRDAVIALAFAPKGDQVLTGSPDSPLLLWEVRTGKLVRQFAFPAEVEEKQRNIVVLNMRVGQVRATFTPDGQIVAGLQRGKTLRRWEATTGKLLSWTKEAKKLSGFAYAPDGRTLALNSDDGVLRLVDPANGKERLQFTWATVRKPDNDNMNFNPSGGVQTALTGFTADSRTVIVAGFMLHMNGLDAGVYFFEAATGQARQKFDSKFDGMRGGGGQPDIEPIATALDRVIVSAVSLPDGRLLATAGFSNIKVWDVAAGKEARMFGGQDVVPWTAAFTPDGKWLIAGQRDGSLRVWDLATSTLLADLPMHDVSITALAFSPDGKTLATGSADTTVVLWDWAELRQQATAKKSAPQATKLAGLWQDLAGADGMKAYSAQVTLIATPVETVAFLKKHLTAVSPVDQAMVEKLLAKLDHRQFKVREEAMKELERMGDLAADAIEKQLQGKLSLEMLLRVGALNDKLRGPMKAGPILQAKRAIEVLERIGTPQARQVLEQMANGAVGHRLTLDAAESLQRLKKGTP